jgi:ribosomal protein L33
MKELIHYICKECDSQFFTFKYIGVLNKRELKAAYCPFCNSHSLFNVNFEFESAKYYLKAEN